MKVWRIVITLKDSAKDDETGETFRHLTRKQIENLVVDNLDLPACVHFEGAFTEEK